MRKFNIFALSAFTVLAAVVLPTQAFAPESTVSEDVKAWLTKFNDSNAYYVVFDSGLIANGGNWTRKWTQYIEKDVIYLWHCGIPTRFQVVSDAHLYLRGKPIQIMDDGTEMIEGEYKTQCQLGAFSGDMRTHIVH